MQRNGTVENKMFNVGKTGFDPKKNSRLVDQFTFKFNQFLDV